MLHLVDMAGVDTRSPIDDYVNLNKELGFYSELLLDKPQVVVANKMDLPQAKDNLKSFKKACTVDCIEISALKGQGLKELVWELRKMIKNQRASA